MKFTHLDNTFLGYYPTAPANVVFAYTLLGIPEFSVAIDGPSLLAPNMQATWTATTSNCSSALTYQWYRKSFGAQNWTNLGITTQTYSSTITGNTNLKVDINCGAQLKTAYLDVYLDDGMHLIANSEKEPESVFEFGLYQNHPNPFFNNTIISYSIPIAAIVKISLLDAFGRELSTMVNIENEAGSYDVELDGKNLNPGIYIVKLSSGTRQAVIKLVKN